MGNPPKAILLLPIMKLSHPGIAILPQTHLLPFNILNPPGKLPIALGYALTME